MATFVIQSYRLKWHKAPVQRSFEREGHGGYKASDTLLKNSTVHFLWRVSLSFFYRGLMVWIFNLVLRGGAGWDDGYWYSDCW